MAEDESAGEKTEKPSGKKISNAREQGMVGQSADLSAVMSMSASFITFMYFSGEIWQNLLILMKSAFTFWSVAESSDFDPFILISAPTIKMTPQIFYVMLAAAICGAFSTLLQTNFLWAPKLFKFNFSQLKVIFW